MLLSKEELLMEPVAGAEITECKREAVAVCAQERIDVSFVHNGRTYRVRWVDLYTKCVEQE